MWSAGATVRPALPGVGPVRRSAAVAGAESDLGAFDRVDHARTAPGRCQSPAESVMPGGSEPMREVDRAGIEFRSLCVAARPRESSAAERRVRCRTDSRVRARRIPPSATAGEDLQRVRVAGVRRPGRGSAQIRVHPVEASGRSIGCLRRRSRSPSKVDLVADAPLTAHRRARRSSGSGGLSPG